MRVLTILIDGPTMFPTWRQIRSLERVGVRMEILAISGTPKLKYLTAFLKQRKLIDSVDLVHAHYGFAGLLARSQSRKPVVVSFMGSDVLPSEAFRGWTRYAHAAEMWSSRRLARASNAVIVKSRQMAGALAPVAAHVIPNGIDLRHFQPLPRCEARAALGWAQDVSYILFPGNPADGNKGFALAQATVKQAVGKTKLSLRLVPLHQVRHDRVPFYMNASDAMLMTSFAEGSPNVVKEAMACNLPAISVPVGDVPELVAGVPGYRVCPRDAGVLALELIRALSGGECAEGRAALIRMGLDQESVARRVIGVYETVLSRKSIQSRGRLSIRAASLTT